MNFDLFKFTLKNNLRVVFQNLPTATSTSLGLWVHLGSRNETDFERGYTHFVEHMLFKGTKKRTAKEQAEDIERVGGFLNAVTSREYTYFYITSAKDDLKLGLDILSDMVFDPLFKEEDVINEGKVILEELKSYEDSPEDYVYDEYFKNIFSSHPLGLDIIGNRKSIQEVNSEKLIQYYNKNYHPSKMVLAIAGNYRLEEIKKLSEDYFSKEFTNSIPNFESIPIQKNYSSHFIKRKLEQVNFLLGANGFARDFKTNVRLGMICNIFGGWMSSRLFQKIREENGLCYSISSFPSSYSDTGLINISCATSKENFLKSVEAIMDEIKILKEKGITDKELEFCKTNQRGSLSIGYEAPENRMTDIASQELYFKTFYSYEERLKELFSVTKDELNSLIQEIFSVPSIHLTAIGNLPNTIKKNLNLKL